SLVRRIMRMLNRPFERQLAFGFLASLAALFGQAVAGAQLTVSDPVEELRQGLESYVRDPGDRDRKLKEVVPFSQDINDLRRAVVLREWRDQDPEEKWAAIDRPHRAAIARLFRQAAGDVLHQGDQTARLAVLNLLAELGKSSSRSGANLGLA